MAPIAEAAPKVSPLAITRRTGFAALRPLQVRYGGHAWRHGAELAAAQLQRAGHAALGDERRARWQDWVDAVESAWDRSS